MNNIVFHLMLIGHLLGDFYFQSAKTAAQKDEKWSELMKHCVMYSLCVFFVFLPFFGHNMLILFSFLSISHLIIDVCKAFILRRIKGKKGCFKNVKWSNYKQTNSFIYDQIAHLLCIMGVFLYFRFSEASLEPILFLGNRDSSFEIPLSVLISWIAGLLLIGKPASVAIRIILNPFKPDGENLESVDSKELQENGIINAGSWIGIFERFIMLVFLSLNQFSAIGFVLTAKSIARYKRITDDPKFSEYYLLGTLLSTIFAICTRFLVF